MTTIVRDIIASAPRDARGFVWADDARLALLGAGFTAAQCEQWLLVAARDLVIRGSQCDLPQCAGRTLPTPVGGRFHRFRIPA